MDNAKRMTRGCRMPKKIRIVTMQMYAEHLGVSYQYIRRAYRLNVNQELDVPPVIRRVARAMAPPNAVIGVHPLWLSTEIEEFEKNNPPERILNEDPRRWRYGTDEALYLVNEDQLETTARKVLNDRERDIFFRRYTLGGQGYMAQNKVAEEFGVTYQRIQKIQKDAEQKVRQALGMDSP